MAETPLVHIIILTWNGKADTLECLISLQHLTYANARILVVDNASEDGTGEAVRNAFPGVEYLQNSSNLRFAGGNNAGIDYALHHGAEYVLLLNNDTIVEPEFLSHLIGIAAQRAAAGMFGPKIYYYHEPKRIWFAGGKIAWWQGWLSHIGIREHDRGQYDEIREVDFLTGCCLMVKREVVERIGKLDERFFLYGEDVDWCLRATRAGFKLLYVPSATLWHKLSVSAGGHLSWFKNWNKLKSQLRLMGRYARWYHWGTIPLTMIVKIPKMYLRFRSY